MKKPERKNTRYSNYLKKYRKQRQIEIALIVVFTLGAFTIGYAGNSFKSYEDTVEVNSERNSAVAAREVLSETFRVVSAYNAGVPAQTDDSPCISAMGENICAALELGYKRCAANFVPLGTDLLIEHFGEYKVTDRTNSRYKNRVDIAMKADEIDKAKNFGLQILKVKILK